MTPGGGTVVGVLCSEPLEEVVRRPDGEPRWCFRCRARRAFVFRLLAPVDRMSYYGPSPSVQCERGHDDGDLFPGRWREWDEPE